MTAILKGDTVYPEDVFQDFFRSYESDQIGSKYRKRLCQVAVANGKSLLIDFEDLIAFDPALASGVIERPDDYLACATSASTAQMRVEDPEYAQQVGRIFVRLRHLPWKIALDKVRAEHIGKLVSLICNVIKVGQVRPMIVSAVFRCRKCLELIVQDQEGELIRGPGSHCPFCKQSTSFELLEERSHFVDTQEVRTSDDLVRTSRHASSKRWITLALRDDLVDIAQPDEKIELTAIVRTRRLTQGTRRTKALDFCLEGNYLGIISEDNEKSKA